MFNYQLAFETALAVMQSDLHDRHANKQDFVARMLASAASFANHYGLELPNAE